MAKGHESQEKTPTLKHAFSFADPVLQKKQEEDSDSEFGDGCKQASLEKPEGSVSHRWQKVVNPSLIKGPWTPEEDQLVLLLVEKNGPQKWTSIAENLPGRIGKQCRERWHNHLNPNIKKDNWS